MTATNGQLPARQRQALAIVREKGKVRAQELADLLGIRQSTAGRLVDRLVIRGYVQRTEYGITEIGLPGTAIEPTEAMRECGRLREQLAQCVAIFRTAHISVADRERIRKLLGDISGEW